MPLIYHVHQEDGHGSYRNLDIAVGEFTSVEQEQTTHDVSFSPEDEQILGRLFIVARKLAKEANIAEKGYRLIVNCNEHGGQEVYHLHFHILPRREGDKLRPPGQMADMDDLKAEAEKIRAALGG